MTLQQENHLRDMQLAFIGKLMAGLSHENKNHLAIIKESCGLIEDLLLLEEPGQLKSLERYTKIISGINDRISLASEMCRFLSSFSHRMDHPHSSFNISEVLQEEIYLLYRFSRQKQVELEFTFEKDNPTIFNNPSLLQFLFFCIIWPELESLEAGGRILITAAKNDQAAKVVLTTEGPATERENINIWQEILPVAATILQAEFTRTANAAGNKEFVIIIPSVK